MEAETRYAKSGDLRIAYQVHGDGPLDLLFAPGYLSHLEQNQWWPEYASFFEKMASFSRLVVFDRRGTGLSDRILALGSFEELMDDIGVVLDAVGSERAALFGGAEGGPMCALFAATFPERTSALVLGASYARRGWAPDYPWGLDEETQQRILDGYEERWGRPGFGARAIAPTLADDERFQVWYAQAQRFSGTPASARAWFRVTMEIDIREVLPAIRVPTLVIHRSGDRVIPVESGRYLAEHIPDAKFVELPGHDHFPFVGDMDALVDEVQEFLTGSRRTREPDRVLATVLFTDIVGSTRLAAELGDRRWTELLAEHHRIVRAELDRHRGIRADAHDPEVPVRLVRVDRVERGPRTAPSARAPLRRGSVARFAPRALDLLPAEPIAARRVPERDRRDVISDAHLATAGDAKVEETPEERDRKRRIRGVVRREVAHGVGNERLAERLDRSRAVALLRRADA